MRTKGVDKFAFYNKIEFAYANKEQQHGISVRPVR